MVYNAILLDNKRLVQNRFQDFKDKWYVICSRYSGTFEVTCLAMTIYEFNA
jgi:hypothetical protein